MLHLKSLSGNDRFGHNLGRRGFIKLNILYKIKPNFLQLKLGIAYLLLFILRSTSLFRQPVLPI